MKTENMPNTELHSSISAQVSTGDDLDFAFLKQFGLDYIAKVSGKIWTDYNTHDPGITMLELLAYAITDLGYRITLPIEDLLSKADNTKPFSGQFFRAEEVLPTKPVTVSDYRKLFIDTEGVKNAWLLPFRKKVYVNCKEELLHYQPFEIEDKYKKEFTLQGLYEILLDFDEFDPEVYTTDTQIEARKKQIEQEVVKKYHLNRNLCEDLMKVSEVGVHPVSVCAIIDVKPDTDEELVHARVIRAIEGYFSPSVRFYALQEMLDKGYATTEIFDGPILTNGFIDPEELEAASLRREVRLSDVVRLIMDIEGVNLIKDISINNCGPDAKPSQPWVICIDEGKKPFLCTKSAFSYTKGVLPVNINQQAVKKYLFQLETEETEAQKKAQLNKLLDVPSGEFLPVGEYATIQNHFPETYGIGEFGLSPSAPDARKAQAKQLQGWLLFFDQILASYFAQLESVKELLAVDNTVARSYFTQAVTDINGIENLIPADYLSASADELAEKLFAALDPKTDRKNRLLDHLLSRFAESFRDYAFLMKQLYGSDATQAVIRTKELFLKSYDELGTERGAAFNYYKQKNTLWNSLNVSTIEKRLALLTGMTDFSRRNLSNDPLEVYQENDDDNLLEYRWRIKTPAQKILLSGSKKYHSKEEMNKELLLVRALAVDPLNYEIKQAVSGEFYFNLTNPAVPDPTDEGHIIARRIDFFATEEEAATEIGQLVDFMKEVKPAEGMYLIEHLLLRPDEAKDYNIDTDLFLPVCDCDDCEPLDPYSFRVSVVLPGWTERFSNMDFRRFMEDLIRRELPAHVLARICWIGYPSGKVDDSKNEMVQLERAWKAFLDTISDKTQNRQIIIDLNTILSRLHSIYPSGFLFDCDDETENLKDKIILGRTNLGNI